MGPHGAGLTHALYTQQTPSLIDFGGPSSWESQFAAMLRANNGGDYIRVPTKRWPMTLSKMQVLNAFKATKAQKAADEEAERERNAQKAADEEAERSRNAQKAADENKSITDGPVPQHAPTRMAVVYNGKGRDTSWITIPKIVNAVDHGRRVSESYFWLSWIIDNYFDLPNYAVFLHGHKNSWHAMSAYDLYKSPVNIYVYGPKIWRGRGKLVNDAIINGEIPYLDKVYKFLFNVESFKAAVKIFNMETFKCCSEMVVTKETMLSVPLSVYRKLLSFIQSEPRAPWGWVLERTWQNLFTQTLVLDGPLRSN